MDNSFTSYHIEERSFVAYVKREIHNLISKAGFDQTLAGKIDIIVSEITSNLIKHAGSGELLYRLQSIGDEDMDFEILSIDKGPGMADPERMLKDGVSTVNTLGHGLGAISRLSTTSHVYSMPGWGTVLYSRVSTIEPRWTGHKTPQVEVRALCVNKPRETVCGDGYRVKKTPNETILFFGDGLGHGERAKEAVDHAGNFLMKFDSTDPVEILKAMHVEIKKTRGMVATIAVCDLASNEWRICGIGNILMRMYTGIMYKAILPYNGTVGLNIPTSLNYSTIPLEKNQQLILCSDGIQTRWDLTKYPGIFKYDPLVMAASIYKDFTRGNDDSSTLVAKLI